MDAHTIALVRSSWGRVAPHAPAVATQFYHNLFAADPRLKALFKGDPKRQGELLMQMIGAAVAKLDDLPALEPTLQALGARHAGYGVRESDYDTVGAALLQTLGEGLADGFTDAVREAWTQVYGRIREVMVTAARGAGPGPPAAAPALALR